MRTIIAGLLLTLAFTLLPPPRITVQNSRLLYAAAVYKTAVGDTESALRLMQRAEQVQTSSPSAHNDSFRAAVVRSALCTIL